jgi:hypothetical protein
MSFLLKANTNSDRSVNASHVTEPFFNYLVHSVESSKYITDFIFPVI